MLLRSFIAATAVFAGSAAISDSYELDSSHTEVIFSWNHAGLTTQRGEWTNVTGEINFDPEDVAGTSAQIEIDANSLHSGFEALDVELKGQGFFDVESNPTITFTSTSAVQTGAQSMRMSGDLVVKGQTVPAVLDVNLVFQGAHPLGGFFDYYEGEWIGIEATSTLLRSEVGVGQFAPLTSDVVQLEISAEMRKDGWPE